MLIHFAGFSQMYLTSQEEIDNYNISNQPTVTESIFIIGEDITNLDSLYSITEIEDFLIIQNTSISNLSGLQNISTIRSFSIVSSPFLSNIDHILHFPVSMTTLNLTGTAMDIIPKFNNLKNINYFTLRSNEELVDISNLEAMEFQNISIKYNTQLSDCAIESVCNNILNFGGVDIVGNMEGCNSREEVLSNCENFEPCDLESAREYSNFDTWSDELLPDEWEGEVDTIQLSDTTLINISKFEPFEGESGHALKLTTYRATWSPFFEGLVSTSFNQPNDFFDISFDYCFEKITEQTFAGRGNLLINNLEIWQTLYNNNSAYVNCSNPKHVILCDIPKGTQPDLMTLTFRNKSISSPVDGALSSAWIIDNLKIEGVPTSTLNVQKQTKDLISVYPNPAWDMLTIDTDSEIETIQIFDLSGKEVMNRSFNNTISIDHLANGIYFIQLKSTSNNCTLKFIKI